MTKLRRCSPEIEHELHDLEARIRELEGALRLILDEIDPRSGEWLMTNPPQHAPCYAARRIARGALATSPPDGEPAEGAGHSSRDFDGTDPRGMGPLPGEPGNPNPSFEQMDAMLERRDALASLDRIDNTVVLDTPNGRTTLGDHKRDEVETIRQALSRTSDAMLERREALEDVEACIEVVENQKPGAEGWAHIDINQLLRIRRALSRTSNEGTGCVVPESIRRLPYRMREHAKGLEGTEAYMACRWERHWADELDRAIAVHEGRTQPEHGESDE